MRPARSLAVVVFSLAAVVLAASCGGTAGVSYPTVTVHPPKFGPPVTTPNGAVVQYPPNPQVYSVPASASCEWVTYESGRHLSQPTLSPPAPGLRAVAITERQIRLEYSFRSLPGDCRPKYLSLGIEASHNWKATPQVEHFLPIHGLSGKVVLTYPNFLPPPDVALASADIGNGMSSRTVTVLIRH